MSICHILMADLVISADPQHRVAPKESTPLTQSLWHLSYVPWRCVDSAGSRELERKSWRKPTSYRLGIAVVDTGLNAHSSAGVMGCCISRMSCAYAALTYCWPPAFLSMSVCARPHLRILTCSADDIGQVYEHFGCSYGTVCPSLRYSSRTHILAMPRLSRE